MRWLTIASVLVGLVACGADGEPVSPGASSDMTLIPEVVQIANAFSIYTIFFGVRL